MVPFILGCSALLLPGVNYKTCISTSIHVPFVYLIQTFYQFLQALFYCYIPFVFLTLFCQFNSSKNSLFWVLSKCRQVFTTILDNLKLTTHDLGLIWRWNKDKMKININCCVLRDIKSKSLVLTKLVVFMNKKTTAFWTHIFVEMFEIRKNKDVFFLSNKVFNHLIFVYISFRSMD